MGMVTPAASTPPIISLAANESAPGRIRNTQWRSVPIRRTELGPPACGIGKGSGRGSGGAGSAAPAILELGRAIFGITISHCTGDPDVWLSLAGGAMLLDTVRIGGGWGAGSSLSATAGTVSFADSSATNNVDHCTRNGKLTARSASPASPDIPIRRGDSTILACESNI